MYTRLVVVAFLYAIVVAEHPIKLRIEHLIDSNIANIHVDSEIALDGVFKYTYGSCNDAVPNDSDQVIAIASGQRYDRLVWKVPDVAQTGGCVSAWNSISGLLGRSNPVNFGKRVVKRTVVPMDNSSLIDAEGPWFDGVALLNGTSSIVDTNAAKAKKIAIVGAGMAGLMTWLCLHQAGLRNLHIVEGSERFGGRVHTEYFGDPSERLYQDMGAMRVCLHKYIQCAGHRLCEGVRIVCLEQIS